MNKYLLVIPSSAREGQEDDYNRWYDEEHLADVCAIPGFVAGRRFDASATSPAVPPAATVAIYEIEADDPDAALKELGRRIKAGEIAISSALDTSTAKMWLYKAR